MTLALVEIVDDATRREFIAMLTAAGLLAGCGSSGDSTAGGGDDPATHQVEDVFGPVTVPVEPQRIACMDLQVLGNVLRLGIDPDRIVGIAYDGVDPAAFTFLAPAATFAGITDVGGFAEPNAEALLAADPDLILIVAEEGFDDFYGPILDVLRSVGVPVFGAFNGYVTLADSMRLLADVGRAVGLEDEAAALEAELRGAIDDLAGRLADAGPLPTAAFLRVTTEGFTFNNVMPLLDELGLPGTRPTPEEFYLELSAEELGQFDHDVLFVSDGDDPDATLAQLESNPLWATLPAVQAGRVHLVADLLWGAAYSVPAYEAQLADIEDALLTG